MSRLSAERFNMQQRIKEGRKADTDRAYKIGRSARIRGLDIKTANVNLAREMGWTERGDFDDALLDECERGWRTEDELREHLQ